MKSFSYFKSRSKADSWLFIIALWAFVLEYATYLVRSNVADKSIKLGALVLLAILVARRTTTLTFQERRALYLLSGFVLSALVPSIYHLDYLGVWQWMKIAFMGMILPIMLLRIDADGQHLKRVVITYVAIGVLFSSQAIAASIAIFGNYQSVSDVLEIGRRPGQVANSLGILGYANAIQNPIECVQILRAQGWFVEPSILAAFLIFPLFISFGYFRLSGSRAALLIFVVIALGLFFTFSLAGYIAVVGGIAFLSLSRSLYLKTAQLGRGFSRIYPLIITAVAIGAAAGLVTTGQFLYLTNLELISSATKASANGSGPCNNGPSVSKMDAFLIASTKMFARDPRGPSGNLNREFYKFKPNAEDLSAVSETASSVKFVGYSTLLMENPFGIGLAHTSGTNEETSGNGLIFWLVSGGVLALVFLIGFFFYVFWTYCHPLLISNDQLARCVAASFIAHAIHNLSYGFWLAPFFLLHLYILVASTRWIKERQEAQELADKLGIGI